MLFNLVSDALAEILKTDGNKGVITHLLLNLVEEDLTHLQYADDTSLFFENSQLNLANLKFLL